MHVCCIYVRALRNLRNNIDNYKVNGALIPLGISYISSSLQLKGYTTEIIYCTEYTYSEGIKKYITKKPDVIAISITSTLDYRLACELVSYLKKEIPDVKIIIGGIYITLARNKIVDKIENIDAICIGAGEKAIVEYVKQVEKGTYYKTDNLWIKTGNELIKCDKVLSIENLDELPFPDRKGWDRWIYCREKQPLLLTRGCVYNCVFCANNALKKVPDNKYFNERSVENVIDELKYIIKEYDYISEINVVSENVLANPDKFRRLCVALKEINDGLKNKLSFQMEFNFTYNLLDKDKDILQLMKDANIKWCCFSLESGSLEIRKKLKKPVYSNEQIIEFFGILRNLGMNTAVWVMYCYPFETKQTYLETIQCLKLCKPDYIEYQFLSPIEYTDLSQFVEKLNYKKVKFIHKFRFNTLEFRVYVSYKSIIETLSILMPKNKYCRKIINFYSDLKNKIKQIYKKVS